MSTTRSIFSRALADRQSDPAGRRWLFVPYDQLSDRIGPLAVEDPGELGIVLIEEAMSAASSGLFHTRISALLNLHRLLPAEVVRDVASMDLPLASKEGFIRQVLGWREFVHHVHEATDGFRSVPDTVLCTAGRPGDGGWSRWSGASWDRQDGDDGSDGGAMPDHLEASRPLPVAYWGRPSGWAFLDRQRGRLESNPRMRVVMDALRKRPDGRLATDRATHRWVAETLGRGEVLRPEDRPGGRPG